MLRIFISYRREDSPRYAGDLYRLLTERFPQSQIFWDIGTIEPGVDFVDEIERAVGSCDVLIALIGRQWLDVVDGADHRRLDDASDFVRLEIATALERNIRVIPALVQGAHMPGPDVLPEPLRRLARRNAFELSDSRWEYDVDQLVAALRRIPPQPLLPPTGKPAPSTPGNVAAVVAPPSTPSRAGPPPGDLRLHMAPAPRSDRAQRDGEGEVAASAELEARSRIGVDPNRRPTGAETDDAPPSTEASANGVRRTADVWWIVGLRGLLPAALVALTTVGSAADMGVRMFLQFSGGYVIVAGILALLVGMHLPGRRRWPFLIEGIAGVAAGALILGDPEFSVQVLRRILGGWAVLTGIGDFVAALQLRRVMRREWMLLVGGITTLALGVAIVGFSSLGLGLPVLAYATIFGLTELALAFRLQRLAQPAGRVNRKAASLEERPSPASSLNKSGK